MKNLILRATLIVWGGLLLTICNMYSNNKLSFRLERLSTDFNGVVYNGRNVLAYGKYGIITYSTDQGETWKQISLGDKLDILKIVTIDSDFYALTPYSILKSTDDGLNWNQKVLFDEPKLKDFAYDDKFFYLATENAIYRIDIGLTGELETLFEFDEFTSISEVVYLKKYLFCIESKYYLYKLNLETKAIDTIDIHQTILKASTYVKDISHLKVYGSTLYLLAESIHQNNPQYTQPESADYNIRHYLIKSTDLGDSWKIVTTNIRLTKEYQVFDGVVYFLTHKGIRDTSTFTYYYTVRYFKINPDGNEEEINKDEMLNRRIPIFTGTPDDFSIPNTFRVNMFLSIGNETIIAVGPNKTILMSKNNGQNWELVSYFKPVFERDAKLKVPVGDTIIVLVDLRPRFFISFDGGATFLPPKRNVENFPRGGNSIVVWDDGTFGFIEKEIFTHTEKINDSTFITKYDSTYFYFYHTTNLGESFSKKSFSRKYIFTSDSAVYWLEKAAVVKDKILCVFTWEQIKQDTVLNSYFYLFDRSFSVVDSSEQNKIHWFYGGNLIIEDSIIYYLETPSLYSSKDFGSNWKTIYSKFSDINYFHRRYKEYFLIINSKQIGVNKYQNKLLKFNLINSTLDSLPLPSSMRFLVYNDTLLGYNNGYLYFFPFGIDNLDIYDSIEIAELLSNEPIRFNNLINVGNGTYFLISARTGSGVVTNIYELNIAKVVYSKPRYLPVELQTENDWEYFYSSPPYPLPAHNIVRSKLYWDGNFDLIQAIDGVYDVMGNRVEGKQRITIKELGKATAELTWNCSGVPSGIYFIVVRHNGRADTIPVIVE